MSGEFAVMLRRFAPFIPHSIARAAALRGQRFRSGQVRFTV